MCQELHQMLLYQCFSNYLGERETKFLNSQTITDPNTFVEYNETIIRKIKFERKKHTKRDITYQHKFLLASTDIKLYFVK